MADAYCGRRPFCRVLLRPELPHRSLVVCSTVTGRAVEVAMRIHRQGSSGVELGLVPIQRSTVLPTVVGPHQLKNVAMVDRIVATSRTAACAPKVPGCIEDQVVKYIVRIYLVVAAPKLGVHPATVERA